MGKWIYIVGTKCDDPNAEEEFNDWYSTMHVPDLLKRVNGLVRASRYRIKKLVPAGKTGPGMPKFVPGPTADEVPDYLAIYELDTDDVDRTVGLIASETRALGELGRMNPHPVVVARYLYRQISDPYVKPTVQQPS